VQPDRLQSSGHTLGVDSVTLNTQVSGMCCAFFAPTSYISLLQPLRPSHAMRSPEQRSCGWPWLNCRLRLLCCKPLRAASV
jgi:hypothetical protein